MDVYGDGERMTGVRGKGGEQIQSLMMKLHSFRYAASLLLRMTCLDRDNYDPTEC